MKNNYMLIVMLITMLLTSCAGTSFMKYNYHERKWQSAGPESELKFNYMENRWEFSR